MEVWSLDWWPWLVLGLILLGVELFVTPGGLYLALLGAAAVAVGLLSATGLIRPLWMQVLLFAVLSLVALVLLRPALLARLKGSRPDSEVDALVGETALALEDLAVDAVGKAELRGSTWSARNIGDGVVARGQPCTVERVDGLTLWVRGA